MSKYTVEVKLQAVVRYLTGNESYKTIAESAGDDKSQVINWVKLFEAQGERGFKKGYTSYSSGFKLDELNLRVRPFEKRQAHLVLLPLVAFIGGSSCLRQKDWTR